MDPWLEPEAVDLPAIALLEKQGRHHAELYFRAIRPSTVPFNYSRVREIVECTIPRRVTIIKGTPLKSIASGCSTSSLRRVP